MKRILIHWISAIVLYVVGIIFLLLDQHGMALCFVILGAIGSRIAYITSSRILYDEDRPNG